MNKPERRAPFTEWLDRGRGVRKVHRRAADKARAEALRTGTPPVEDLAAEVMRALEEHGPAIVPHLLDSDDNPGERLRSALRRLGRWPG